MQTADLLESMSPRLLQALALLTIACPRSAEARLGPAHPHGKPTVATWTRVERAHTANERSTEFSWDALNVTTIMCGVEKCYFPSQREGEGWLVGRTHRGFPQWWFPQWGKAWRLAEELRVGFGVKHLLEGPPLLATLSPGQATYLNAKIMALNRHHLLQHGPKWRHIQKVKNITEYYVAGYHAVQKVRSCSWPECMVLKCNPQYHLKYLSEDAIDRFVANAPDKAKLSQGIDQSFTVVAAMVKAHPCLRIDFQVYLRNDGAVLNIDLDRCFHRNGTIVACSSLDLPCNKSSLDVSTSHLAQLPALCKTGDSQAMFDKTLANISGSN